MARNTYKYHFKRGHKTLHTGITDDLERREQEQRLCQTHFILEKIDAGADGVYKGV